MGSPVVLDHVCVCGVHVLPNGHHGLSCRRSAGRNTRHTAINGILARAFASADVPTLLEPLGLLMGDGKRPDVFTLLPWAKRRCLLWDFTCPDTLAPSHINKSSLAKGSAASEAEAHKFTKYSEFLFAHTFIPLRWRPLGCMGQRLNL